MISTPAWIDGRSRVGDGDDQRAADAGNGEDLLDDDDAAEQITDVERDDGDDRQQRVAQRMADQHGALAAVPSAGRRGHSRYCSTSTISERTMRETWATRITETVSTGSDEMSEGLRRHPPASGT